LILDMVRGRLKSRNVFRRPFLVRLILAGGFEIQCVKHRQKRWTKKRLLPGAGGGYPRSFKKVTLKNYETSHKELYY
jgi:hypothetical protein